MLHGMETGEERWQCGVPGMWDLGQLITAQSDPGKLLLALLLPSSPKHRRKVPREKELTKPEVTNDHEEGMLPGKTESMELLGPNRNLGTLADVWVKGWWCSRIIQDSQSSLSVVSNSLQPHGLQHTQPTKWPQREVGGWGSYSAFLKYILIEISPHEKIVKLKSLERSPSDSVHLKRTGFIFLPLGKWGLELKN